MRGTPGPPPTPRRCLWIVATWALLCAIDPVSCTANDAVVFGLPGTRLTLSCETESTQDTCIWESADERFRKIPLYEGTRSSQHVLRGSSDPRNCSITIDGLKDSDNGLWKCITLKPNSDQISSKSVTVHVIKKPRLLVEHPLGQLRDQQSYEFVCHAREARPVPSLVWIIRNGTDIRFVIQTSSQETIMDDPASPANTTFSATSILHYRASYLHDGFKLVCVANLTASAGVSLNGQNFTAESEYILSVTFSPKPWSGFPHVARLPSRNAHLTVFFVSNPPPSPKDIRWEIGTTVIKYWSDHGNFKIHPIECHLEGFAPSVCRTVLNMGTVSEGDYKLTVRNSLGEGSIAIKVTTEKEEGDLSSGAIAGIIVGVLLILAIIFLLVFLKAGKKLCFRDGYRYPWQKRPFSPVSTSERCSGDGSSGSGRKKQNRFLNRSLLGRIRGKDVDYPTESPPRTTMTPASRQPTYLTASQLISSSVPLKETAGTELSSKTLTDLHHSGEGAPGAPEEESRNQHDENVPSNTAYDSLYTPVHPQNKAF